MLTNRSSSSVRSNNNNNNKNSKRNGKENAVIIFKVFLFLFFSRFLRNVYDINKTVQSGDDDENVFLVGDAEEEVKMSNHDEDDAIDVIKRIEKLSNAVGPMRTLDPFLFCVYHSDRYPEGDEFMGLKNGDTGTGNHFHSSVPYRFYHGHKIPGFPRHPHRGFETITATIEGIIDHADSIGNAGRYGEGDLQWMTAGKGIQHGEMFPLINADKGNPSRFFQIWLNLPKKSKMSEPAFVMHWKNEVKKIKTENDVAEITIFTGSFGSNESSTLERPENSWANTDENDVGIFYFELKKTNSKVFVPRANIANEANRYLYFIEGEAIQIGEIVIRNRHGIELDAAKDFYVKNVGDDDDALCAFLILQGRPIKEPVASHGPFVMNTEEEIRQSFADYERTEFGSWRKFWHQNDVVFPRWKKRFMRVNGIETFAPLIDS